MSKVILVQYKVMVRNNTVVRRGANWFGTVETIRYGTVRNGTTDMVSKKRYGLVRYIAKWCMKDGAIGTVSNGAKL